MRRNIGCHSHGDPGGTVHQQIGYTRGKDNRFFCGTIVVRSEINRFRIDIGKHLFGQKSQPRFRIPVRRGRITVNGSKVALSVNQAVAHVEVLGHAHQGIVNRAVSMGVVFLQNFANNPCAF